MVAWRSWVGFTCTYRTDLWTSHLSYLTSPAHIRSAALAAPSLLLETSTKMATTVRAFTSFMLSYIYTRDERFDSNLRFADVAISCPFGGENKQGLVFIYNGFSGGLREKPSQVIAGQWASTVSSHLPASFGYALRGGEDLDYNGYPGENKKWKFSLGYHKSNLSSFILRFVSLCYYRSHCWCVWCRRRYSIQVSQNRRNN